MDSVGIAAPFYINSSCIICPNFLLPPFVAEYLDNHKYLLAQTATID